MISLSFEEKKETGFQYVRNLLEPVCPYGVKRLREEGFYAPDQRDELDRELENVDLLKKALETDRAAMRDLRYRMAALKDLYHLRWGIENAFRELKYDIGLNNFHAKREDFIIQEIFAKLFMYNFAQRIIIDVVVVKSRGKYAVYQINYTYAIHLCRDFFRKGAAPPGFNRNIRMYVEPVRPGRHDERKLYPKGFVPFIYRVA